MGTDVSVNNKRIAKNTLLLYVRMLFMLVVSLFTSRVVLDSLGEDNYGIYNVVGGVVAMFSILSGPLSAAITRFLTFELGTGNKEKLAKVFCTSVNIQVLMSFVILLICEIVGLWFLNTQMNIPTDRMVVANFVLQWSLATFVVNLLTVPYNAIIISHEKMDVFAYLSILEVSIKLGIAYLIYVSPFDKLNLYSALLLGTSLLLLVIYYLYCQKYFEETKYHIIFDKSLFKEMSYFAGWNLFGNTSWMLNTQGVNMLINIFFGVKINAARAFAVQVQGAIQQFVNNFTTAINPQITKSYASKDYDYLFSLINRGSKYSYFIMFIFVVPVVLEADTILSIWLKQVPEQTSIFMKLVTFTSLAIVMGNSMMTGIMATGNIKRYEIIVTSVACLVFPFTWIAYELGAPAYSTYIIYGVIYFILNFIRIATLKRLMNFPVTSFLKDVLLRIVGVSIACFIVPTLLVVFVEPSFWRLLYVCLVSAIWSLICIWVVGLDSKEKFFFASKIKIYVSAKFHRNK